MNAIIEPNDNFSFDKLTLTSPIVMAGGNHFIKYVLNDKPLYIQPPNCKLKQGIVKAGKRAYCDLMFTNENENFIRWMENLENFSRKFIYNNRVKWFETEPSAFPNKFGKKTIEEKLWMFKMQLCC